MSTLYVVGTPIGNLKDITLRALETLKEADLIVCEDTRHTRKLLSAYDIHKPLVSCHANKEAEGAAVVLGELAKGRNAAYVTDAGTPAVSDPGSLLVREVRRAGFSVLPIPGVSAAATALSVAGFEGKSVLFEGFLSTKSGKRRKRLRELFERGETFIIFESPYRILTLLKDIADIAPDSMLLIGREMTKVHEEFLLGSPGELSDALRKKTAIKGEFTLIASGHKKS